VITKGRYSRIFLVASTTVGVVGGLRGRRGRIKSEELEAQGISARILPPELAHPANRPCHTAVSGSRRMLLISKLAHEGARFHGSPRFRCAPIIQVVII